MAYEENLEHIAADSDIKVKVEVADTGLEWYETSRRDQIDDAKSMIRIKDELVDVAEREMHENVKATYSTKKGGQSKDYAYKCDLCDKVNL